jgi:hypothetical protein
VLKPEQLERLGGYGFKQTKCHISEMNQALPDFEMALFAVPGWHFTRYE